MDDKAVQLRTWVQRSVPKPLFESAEREPSVPWRKALVFDCETLVFPQRLLFGTFKLIEFDDGLSPVRFERTGDGDRVMHPPPGLSVSDVTVEHLIGARVIDEGVFYRDDLTDEEGLSVLEDYCRTVNPGIRLTSRSEFVDDVLLKNCYHNHDTYLVGFNLPFDISRIATDVADATKGFKGGFSFTISDAADAPKLRVKHIGNRRSFFDFSGSNRNRGRILDVASLAFTLVSEKMSLLRACEVFEVTGKKQAGGHGTITLPYIDYAVQDTTSTAALFVRCMERLERLNVDLPPERAYSAASTDKALLRKMGITPFLKRFADSLTPDVLGRMQAAYYGGRSESHVRAFDLPVEVRDYKSEYPTVMNLLDTWSIVIAETLNVVGCTAEAQAMLDSVTADDLYDPSFWPKMRGFASLVPDGDILPARANYDERYPQTFTIGSVHLHGVDSYGVEHEMSYALPDLVASKILTGRAPKLRSAFRLDPVGTLPDLSNVNFGVDFSPYVDISKQLIEQRLQCYDDPILSLSFKISANAFYGVTAQFNPDTGTDPVLIDVTGCDGETWQIESSRIEEPGEYCFPAISALTTSGGRLLLAMLEHAVTSRGGSWVFCDTDSMAIIATETGGMIRCPGGGHWIDDIEHVKALSYGDVAELSNRFQSLCPYNTERPIQMLETKQQSYCRSYGPKFYCLFDIDENGRRTIVEAKEFGFGSIFSPAMKDDGGIGSIRDFARAGWSMILGIDTEEQRQRWANFPAISRLNVSTPYMLSRFVKYNEGKSYDEQLNPFSFVMTPHVEQRPLIESSTKHERPPLVAAFNPDPGSWEGAEYFPYRNPSTRHGRWNLDTVFTAKGLGEDDTPYNADRFFRFRTTERFVEGLVNRADNTFCDYRQRIAGRNSRGVLSRRNIRIGSVRYMGKEFEQIEEHSAGLISYADTEDVYERRASLAQVNRIFRILEPMSDHELADRMRLDVGHGYKLVNRLRNGERFPTWDEYERLQRVAASPRFRQPESSAVMRWNVDGVIVTTTIPAVDDLPECLFPAEALRRQRLNARTETRKAKNNPALLPDFVVVDPADPTTYTCVHCEAVGSRKRFTAGDYRSIARTARFHVLPSVNGGERCPGHGIRIVTAAKSSGTTIHRAECRRCLHVGAWATRRQAEQAAAEHLASCTIGRTEPERLTDEYRAAVVGRRANWDRLSVGTVKTAKIRRSVAYRPKDVNDAV